MRDAPAGWFHCRVGPSDLVAGRFQIQERSRASIYIPFRKHELIREQQSLLVM